MNLLLGLIVFTFSISEASAQDAINTRLLTTSDSLETMSVEDAMGPNSGMSKRKVLTRISYDLTTRPLIAIDQARSNQRFTVINQMHSSNVGLGTMLSNRIFVGMDVPVHYVSFDQSYMNTYGLNGNRHKVVLGDFQLRSKIRLSNDKSKIHFAIIPFVTLPSGNERFFVSDDSFTVGGKIILDASPAPFFHLYGNAGYAYARSARFLNVDRSKRIELAVGGLIDITDSLGINMEGNGAITFPGYDIDQNPVSMRLGWRMITQNRLHWFCGLAWDGLRDVTNNRGVVYASLKVPFGVAR